MMTSQSSLLSYFPTGDYYTKKENVGRIGANGNSCLFKTNTTYGALSHKNGGLSYTSTVGFRLNFGLSANPVRTALRTTSYPTARAYPNQNNGYVLPAKWKKVDVHKRGLITDEGGYQQTFVIRACEIGPDKAATMETILGLLQETSLNHIVLLGIVVDGFGGTHGMKSHNLAWVISRVEVEVDRYPGW
ncbi:palmitoyl-acyl carrier protein thioesterase, chloroplastic-like [Rhododendron vialii]|uniref:palmitoyl-acyl carrier protein thioesterase, chloroplastic-like n=1 Tax=Rhododendron vialii TaxID=182163 RepID=UPI00265FA710|nr:palmitoyl-acyl carrier protein thioesterase, chloroplastic-like [Rhododendron vialii]